jgi:hypothetical protein
MKLVREKTNWSKSPYPVKNHDYLVSDGMEFCHGMRKAGSDKWEQFGKRKKFNKAWRKFEQLNEKPPKEFVKPYTADPWESIEYNSLESFM